MGMFIIKKITLLVTFFICFCNTVVLGQKVETVEQKAGKLVKVAKGLNPKVARLALNAFVNSKNHGVSVKKPIITIIDYSQASTVKRLWVLDLENEKVLHNSMVAHGVNSGQNYTTSFSNNVGSLQTSLGTFITSSTYFGRDGYSLRMKGLEEGVNDRAEERYIVIHGASYVSQKFIANAGRAGRSWGCPAVEKHLAKPIIDTIKGGTLVFSYYPDKTWLASSKFVNRVS